MNMKFARMGAVVCCALLVTGRALAEGADGGALIDALVKKGVLSSQEGEDIRSEMMNDYAGTPGGFLSVGSGAVKGLKL
jgi:polyhydroxyalkanoate synthesis regulator phasin